MASFPAYRLRLPACRLRLPSRAEFLDVTVRYELRQQLHSRDLWNTAASDVRGTIEKCRGKSTSGLLRFCPTPPT